MEPGTNKQATRAVKNWLVNQSDRYERVMLAAQECWDNSKETEATIKGSRNRSEMAAIDLADRLKDWHQREMDAQPFHKGWMVEVLNVGFHSVSWYDIAMGLIEIVAAREDE